MNRNNNRNKALLVAFAVGRFACNTFFFSIACVGAQTLYAVSAGFFDEAVKDFFVFVAWAGVVLGAVVNLNVLQDLEDRLADSKVKYRFHGPTYGPCVGKPPRSIATTFVRVPALDATDYLIYPAGTPHDDAIEDAMSMRNTMPAGIVQSRAEVASDTLEGVVVVVEHFADPALVMTAQPRQA